MGITTERRLAALTRVYTLCTETPLPAGLDEAPPGFATQVTVLKKSIDVVTAAITAQGAGMRVTAHSTRERRALRRALRHEQLVPLAHAARALEQAHPGTAAHFRLPPSNARESQLLGAATAMANEAAKPEFTPLFAAQLGTDFLDRLNGAIQAIATSGDTNEVGRRGHVAATAGMETALAEGRHAVVYLLAMVGACCSTLAKTDAVAAAQTLRQFETAARVVWPGRTSAAGDAAAPAASAGPSGSPAAGQAAGEVKAAA